MRKPLEHFEPQSINKDCGFFCLQKNCVSALITNFVVLPTLVEVKSDAKINK